MTSIRRALTSDLEQVCTLHRESIRRLCSSSYGPRQIAAWTEGLHPDRYLGAVEKLEFFVAESSGMVVGFCILDLQNAEVNAVYVHPGFVGQHVGTALLSHAEGLARDRSLAELRLKSTLNAVGFYERSGYIRGRETVHINSLGLRLPCVEMTKSLDTESFSGGAASI
jgi:GNAT superfamily N-acetyltransferase